MILGGNASRADEGQRLLVQRRALAVELAIFPLPAEDLVKTRTGVQKRSRKPKQVHCPAVDHRDGSVCVHHHDSLAHIGQGRLQFGAFLGCMPLAFRECTAGTGEPDAMARAEDNGATDQQRHAGSRQAQLPLLDGDCGVDLPLWHRNRDEKRKPAHLAPGDQTIEPVDCAE